MKERTDGEPWSRRKEFSRADKTEWKRMLRACLPLPMYVASMYVYVHCTVYGSKYVYVYVYVLCVTRIVLRENK